MHRILVFENVVYWADPDSSHAPSLDANAIHNQRPLNVFVHNGHGRSFLWDLHPYIQREAIGLVNVLDG